eukprot:6484657-Heterocapsa_arctica.AAC.1
MMKIDIFRLNAQEIILQDTTNRGAARTKIIKQGKENESKEKMKRQATADVNEKGKTNNTKAKATNQNKVAKKKTEQTGVLKDGDNVEARTLEEWWEKTRTTVLTALAKEEEMQKARDKLLQYHVQNRTDTSRMRMELEMYETEQISKDILDIEEERRKNKAITISDDE